MSFLTPSKKTSVFQPHTIDSAALSISRFQASSIDFKAKTFELMDEVVELKAKQKEYLQRISILEEQVSKETKFNSRVLEKLNCGSKEQSSEKIEKLTRLEQEIAHKNYNPYKNETDQLLRRMNQITIQYQIEALKQKKGGQEANRQILSENVSEKKDNSPIKEELQILKSQMANLLAENSSLRDQNEQLQGDLSRSIAKFESLEKVVTEKINEYSVEIEEYQQEIEKSHQMIKKLKKEMPESDKQGQFSFGDEENESGQADHKGKGQDKNDILCYQASIDGLMDENKRLKKVLQALYRVKHGESVSEETEREINIMERIIALNADEHL